MSSFFSTQDSWFAPKPEKDAREGRFLFDVTLTAAQFIAMAAEAHMIITYRTLGILGLWPVNAGENTHMILEKPAAMAQSAEAWLRSGLQGERPDQMLSAALSPVRARTKDNAERLARLNPWA